MSKQLLGLSYIAIVGSMATATIVEKYQGTEFAYSHIYGAWWFTLLWAILAAFATVYFIHRKVRRLHSVMLHMAFIVILLGALLTHLTAQKGMIHLRTEHPTNTYITTDGSNEKQTLPFTITLDKFTITYHSGTDAVADYRSDFTIKDGTHTSHGSVSMNNIYSHAGIRLYQSSYDNDGHGSHLTVNYDPWGIPVTYCGYALLFVSLVWMLIDPKGAFRRLLRNPQLKRGTLIVTLFISVTVQIKAAPVLPRNIAAKFGELNIVYNDRVCPIQTFATDFTKKLCGKTSYNGFTAEQILTGFIFWGEEWSNEPIMKMKNGPLRNRLQLPSRCSVNMFFNTDMGGYILGPYIQELSMGNTDKFHQDVADTDARLMLVMELRRGIPLRIFPYHYKGITKWYGPTDYIDAYVPETDKAYMQNIFSLLYQYALDSNYDEMEEAIAKMKKYQEKNGGNSLPSPTQTQAERLYNTIPFATILFVINLTMGFFMLVIEIRRMVSDKQTNGTKGLKPRFATKWINRLSFITMCLSFASLTMCEILRWIISGNIPMSNGYETMLFVAWSIMLLTMITYRFFRIVLTFGFLMSGFFLLVSHISQMDPNITHIMPVLNSPLLSAHVSIIMISFALLALTFICGLTALGINLLKKIKQTSADINEQLLSLQLLSRLFLYPALATLGIGIFIGAIWANVSWGQYWGWDPKEVWALITFMIYSIAVHTDSIPQLRKPLAYHTFISAAFLTVLMTYFGVNYVLGGMHSYA